MQCKFFPQQNRKWNIPESQVLSTTTTTERERFLEQRIKEIEEQFAKFQEQFTSKKGDPKKCKNKNKNISDQISEEAQRRLRSFLESEQGSSSSFRGVEPSAPPLDDFASEMSEQRAERSQVSADKFVFVRKIEVLLNGTPIDQVEDKQNEDECMQAYWRMFAFNGQINSLFSNGISYDDFRYSSECLSIFRTTMYHFMQSVSLFILRKQNIDKHFLFSQKRIFFWSL